MTDAEDDQVSKLVLFCQTNKIDLFKSNLSKFLVRSLFLYVFLRYCDFFFRILPLLLKIFL